MECEEKIQKVKSDCIAVQNLQGMIRLNTTGVTAGKTEKWQAESEHFTKEQIRSIWGPDHMHRTEPCDKLQNEGKRIRDKKDARIHSACCFWKHMRNKFPTLYKEI